MEPLASGSAVTLLGVASLELGALGSRDQPATRSQERSKCPYDVVQYLGWKSSIFLVGSVLGKYLPTYVRQRHSSEEEEEERLWTLDGTLDMCYFR